ncbi:hypothetical protein NQZ79_g6942 [Umbelopsis isabellina]|nr:hypothetical protein NQZ79_g6942 [Umbelopsis isabellina]
MADPAPKAEVAERLPVYSNVINYELLMGSQSHSERSPSLTEGLLRNKQKSVEPQPKGLGQGARLAATRSEVREEASKPMKRKELKIKISNLNKKTLAGTIRNAFMQYGELEMVDVILDDNDLPSGAAVLLYRPCPENVDFLKKPLTLDGRSIKLEATDIDTYNRRNWRDGRLRSQKARLDADKLVLGTMSTPSMLISEWETQEYVGISFNYKMRNMQIFFSHNREKYRLEFRFKDMDGDIRMVQDGKTYYMTIQLKTAPRYWKQNPKGQRMTKLSWSMSDQWERITSIPLQAYVPASKTRAPLMPIGPPNGVNIGQWVVYHLTITPHHTNMEHFQHIIDEAANYNLLPRTPSLQLNTPLIVRPASQLAKPMNHIGRARFLPFDVLYMLECVVQARFLNEYNLEEPFYDILKKLDPDISCRIMEIFMNTRKRVWNPVREFHDTWDKLGSQLLKPRKVPAQYAFIRKFLVTPSTMYPQIPNMETTNRVVRHFHQYADRFARVQFLDDSLGRVGGSNRGFSNEAIYNRIFDVLQNGIQVGSRRYEFLAFSSSQLREHGCWFFAPTKDLRANHIRAWMGNFSHVRIVAKHSARMGQCFSSTQAVLNLKQSEVKTINEVVKNGFTFSDGVGKISPELAREVTHLLDLPVIPSAYQFRLGGAKGVLTLAHDVTGRQVQLRPSQIKFDSKHYMLEVIRTSVYIPSYLNRQAITILSSLGVTDDIFLEMVDSMLDSMSQMIRNPVEAIRVLQANVDEYGTARSMARILAAGFLDRRDPYILNLLHLFRVAQLKELKKKAKILVPQGAYLLGVLDETNSLKENEIFVQITSGSTDGRVDKTVIEEECILFRNPCFHPGDVRVVRAVDYPALHHLVNVIVFPSQGYRDLASMCSGGDLDGDDYSIFWDQRLLPRIKNYPPMDYKADQPLTVDQVTISHVQKFFVNYINNDNLGQIANAHLAAADRSPRGAMDGACIRLAQLHSLAVDFPKSGKPAKLDEELRVRVFPDFMEKKDKETYHSKKILGKIYRKIDKKDYKQYKEYLSSETKYDPRLYVTGMERYISEARDLKMNYDRDIKSLMNQFGIQSEAEMVSGYIIKWLRKDNKHRSHEAHKQSMTASLNLRKAYRAEFYQEFLTGAKQHITHDQIPEVEAKAAAWYYVTYHEDEFNRVVDNRPESDRFLSFCWIVDTHLCKIAKKNDHRKADEVPCLVDLELVESSRKSDQVIDVLGRSKLQDLRKAESYLIDDGTTVGEGEDELGPVISIKLNQLQNGLPSIGYSPSVDHVEYPDQDKKHTIARADDGIDGLMKALGFEENSSN